LNPANYAPEFLKYVLSKYPDTTYWLTTHCNGDASVPVQYIGHLFDQEIAELMKLIKPTSWETAKTRAIDFSEPFLWFDDDLFYEVLRRTPALPEHPGSTGLMPYPAWTTNRAGTCSAS
jgi:hypothetical protein